MHGTIRRAWEEFNDLLARAGLDIALVRRSSAEALGYKFSREASARGPLPPGADEYLRTDHPRLAELCARYHGHPASGTSEWSQAYLVAAHVLPYFRADGPYIWQQVGREAFDTQLVLTALYARHHDRLGLVTRLSEDGLFGVRTVDVDGQLVSRDLLDSAMELDFLQEALGVSEMVAPTILDIGAGYGRLAHRGAKAFPGSRWLCTDGVPLSTFISEYYLRFRNVTSSRVIPLDYVQNALAEERVDIAVNVHSFSECSLAAISWWLDRLVESDVPYLMLVPNTGKELLSTERVGRQYFNRHLEQRGYFLEYQRDKYAGSRAVQQHGVVPSTYFLFARRSAT